MYVDFVSLSFCPQAPVVGVRELCGRDEQLVSGTGTFDAIRLLDGVLVSHPAGDANAVSAREMTACDRDKLLAALYRRTYGREIKSSTRCTRCGELFDLDFSLQDLLQSLSPPQEALRCRQPDGTFFLDSIRFRLPVGADECAVLGLTREEAVEDLLRRCVIEAAPSTDPAKVQTAMANLAPIADLDLPAICPECGAEETVHFDLQSFLLASLKQEKERLFREVHLIASAYGWSLDAILSLSRSVRRNYAGIIESEAPLQRRSPL